MRTRFQSHMDFMQTRVAYFGIGFPLCMVLSRLLAKTGGDNLVIFTGNYASYRRIRAAISACQKRLFDKFFYN